MDDPSLVTNEAGDIERYSSRRKSFVTVAGRGEEHPSIWRLIDIRLALRSLFMEAGFIRDDDEGDEDAAANVVSRHPTTLSTSPTN
jgi:hypothetical protein